MLPKCQSWSWSGIWCLVSGVWCLVFGVWCLVSGRAGALASGVWHLELELVWHLELELVWHLADI